MPLLCSSDRCPSRIQPSSLFTMIMSIFVMFSIVRQSTRKGGVHVCRVYLEQKKKMLHVILYTELCTRVVRQSTRKGDMHVCGDYLEQKKKMLLVILYTELCTRVW